MKVVTQPAAWATWVEALLDINLLQRRDTAAAWADCVARMAHVLGEQHVQLLLELERLCPGAREIMAAHLAAETANSAKVADSAAGGAAAAGDATEWVHWWKRAKVPLGGRPAAAPAATAALFGQYPPQPVPPPPPPAPTVRRPAIFDLSLCDITEGLSIEDADGASQTIERQSGISGGRHCCAPLTAVLQPGTGTYEFIFKIKVDSCAGSGVGVITAEGRSTLDLAGGWPNIGQPGVWWLRRQLGQTYSESREHPSTGTVPLDKEVRMVVDMNAGTLTFTVDGKERASKCKGIHCAVSGSGRGSIRGSGRGSGTRGSGRGRGRGGVGVAGGAAVGVAGGRAVGAGVWAA